MKWLITICAAIVLFCSVHAIAGTWTTLADKPGATNTWILGISGSNLVGLYSTNNGQSTSGFLYNMTTQSWTNLPINAYGIDGSNIVGDNHLYNMTTQNLTTLNYPGAYTTSIAGIRGSNLVGRCYDENGYGHNFFYNGSSWTTIDHPGAAYIVINGIDGNNLVGHYNATEGGRGFLYNGTTWTTLNYPGASGTSILGISGSNLVGYYETWGQNGMNGFLYNMTTQSWTTLTYPGGYGVNYTQILGISGGNLLGRCSDASGSHSFLYTIPEPTPPVADAGFDQTVTDTDGNGSEQVTLDGSGSSDSDGAITSWVWTDDLEDTIPDGEITTVTLSVGIHTITLTVTDDDGLTDTDTVTVTIEPYPNQPPVADADGPYTIYVGDTLTLNASGSTDDDNDIVSYIWDLDDNNSFETDAGSNAVFDVNYTCLQSLGLLVNNTYNIHLKVTDSEGQSDVNDTTLTIIPTPALLVFVDIKPGSCPNPLNVKSSGVLPVAILGTADFDITTIDPTSIRLAGVSPLRSNFEDVAGPPINSNDCNCTEDGPDGFLDLTLKFKTQNIVEAIGDVNEGDVLTLELTGVLIGERPIEGTDCILIRGKHKPCNKFDINKDGVVDSQDFAIFAENWLQSSIVED
jgi:hypothetical protein